MTLIISNGVYAFVLMTALELAASDKTCQTLSDHFNSMHTEVDKNGDSLVWTYCMDIEKLQKGQISAAKEEGDE